MRSHESAHISLDSNISQTSSKTYSSLKNINEVALLHINVQSLRNKLGQLEVVLKSKHTDIVCVNEHWLQEDEVSFYVPENFLLASYYCRSPPLTHGGSSIFVKTNIRFEKINLANYCTNSTCEAAAVTLPEFNLIIISIYRTPNSDVKDFFQNIEKLLQFILNYKNCKNIILTGDFNIDINLKTKGETHDFLNMLRSFDLYCINCQPTRNTACLDNIATNIYSKSYKYSILKQGLLSDHAGIWANFKINKIKNWDDSQSSPISKRILTDYKLACFKMDLLKINWASLFNIENVNDAFDYFFNVVMYYSTLI